MKGILALVGISAALVSCQMLTSDQYNVKQFGTTYNPNEPISCNLSYSFSVFGNGGILYLADSNVLTSLQTDTRAVVPIHRFSQIISAMDYANDIIYLSEGNNYWAYNTITSALTQIGTTADPVYNLAVVGDFLLVDESSNNSSTYSLVRLTDHSLATKKDWTYDSRSFAYSATLGRVFHLRDGISPDDICYEDINTTTGAITASGDSPYHGDYRFGHPLVVFPDGARILTSTGYVFDAKTLIETKNFYTSYRDVVFSGEFLFLATTDNQVKKYKTNSTLDFVQSVRTYSGRIVKMYSRDSKIFVLYQDSEKLVVDVIG